MELSVIHYVNVKNYLTLLLFNENGKIGSNMIPAFQIGKTDLVYRLSNAAKMNF